MIGYWFIVLSVVGSTVTWDAPHVGYVLRCGDRVEQIEWNVYTGNIQEGECCRVYALYKDNMESEPSNEVCVARTIQTPELVVAGDFEIATLHGEVGRYASSSITVGLVSPGYESEQCLGYRSSGYGHGYWNSNFVSLERDKRYRVKLKYRSVKDNVFTVYLSWSIGLKIGVQMKGISLGWQDIEYEFLALEERVRLHLRAEGSPVEVYVDDVSVKLVE